MKFLPCLVAAAFVALPLLPACGQTNTPAHAPSRIELEDQFGQKQTLTFPATNVTVLTIADREGSKQVGEWAQTLDARFGSRIRLAGIADTHGAPWFVKGRILSSLKKTYKHPVMIDWEGAVTSKFRCVPDAVNIFVFTPQGELAARCDGPMKPESLQAIVAAVEKF
ncbi:MAG: hypothetical protein U1F98_12795 [Verrucomicrobiota bacterium]